MDKLTMAHEFMMKKMETETIDNHWELFYSSWRYADAMQAEADKRAVKLPDIFFDTKQNEEWQPDWSQAPEYAMAWQMCSTGDNARWLLDERQEYACVEAPTFNYQGNWQESLRKRPQ
ncbi:MAG: Acinetobacter phage [Pseudomonadota bacterium]|jgi:hypothetical protein